MLSVLNKHIVIVGAARSGVAVAVLLKQKGASVYLTDNGSIQPNVCEQLSNNGIEFEQNGHTDKAKEADFLVVSPGVPTKAPLVQHYLNEGKEVFSELEVASWFNPNNIIAVTGSNGKTTTTSWLEHVWKLSGREFIVGGNIGQAFSSLILDRSENIESILEVSSFQLDHIKTFKPKVSVLLNITPDHLDRYDGVFDNYAQSKFKIFQNQGPEDFLVYNYDDPRIKAHVEAMSALPNSPKTLAFSVQGDHKRDGAFIAYNSIMLRYQGSEEQVIDVDKLALAGKHNLQNAMAVICSARAAEIKKEHVRESMTSFGGVEHRLEKVRVLDGVTYINDSKATNVNAVWFALESNNTPMALILGGKDKGNDYSEIFDLVRDRVHTIIAIGSSKNKVKASFESIVPNLIEADTMEEAVLAAQKMTKRGEVVLLSPACASFDMFNSYEHRGEVFKEIVNKLEVAK